MMRASPPAEQAGMDATDSSKPAKADPPVRSLRIEADGDWCKRRIRPKIRIMGKWLERAGFKPGGRVSLTCVAPGVIELRSTEASAETSVPQLGSPASLPGEPDAPF